MRDILHGIVLGVLLSALCVSTALMASVVWILWRDG